MKTQKKTKTDFFNNLKALTKVSCIIPTTCARSALVQGLRAAHLGRMDEILVPPYMCQAVLSAISRTSFPTMACSLWTKAILVFHQFGFPQDITFIEKEARGNGWLIVNDCAHTIFSRYKGQNVLGWGDFSVLSFSKIFPCVLGGALVSPKKSFAVLVQDSVNSLSQKDKAWVEKAYKVLEANQQKVFGDEAVFEIAAVYGFLPEMVSFPYKAGNFLPKTREVLEQDVDRRIRAWTIIRSFFPRLVPDCPECDVVPWAVPVKGDIANIKRIVPIIKKKTGVSLPILHFDFARNMLHSNYQPALIIECSNDLVEKQLLKICEELKTLGF